MANKGSSIKNSLGGGSRGSGKRRWTVIGGLILAVLVVFCLVVMAVNYRFPKLFDPKPTSDTPGVYFTTMLIDMSEQMTEHWLPNDIIWPTVFLDNPQNFQLGLLETVRNTTRVLRDKLSRQRTTDKIDTDAEAAFVYFSNDPFKWFLPSAESKFKSGVKSLQSYHDRVVAGAANFYPRADNLTDLLDQYMSVLGGVNTRLSNAPRRKGKVLTEETAGDPFSKGEKYIAVDIPWTQIDNNFYFAQGVAYGLRQMMVAVRHDFNSILELKRATELADRIIEVLDETQFEPIIVLNGDPGSIWANHSIQLQSLLEDVRQKMRSLEDMTRT